MSDHHTFFPDFEAAIERAVGDRVRSSDEDACAVWCAMANIQWSHKDYGVWDGWTFRSAGTLIERMRRPDDWHDDYMGYMRWYCCGVDGIVEYWIAEALAKEGWMWRRYPERKR